jgi:phage-related protein
LDTVGTLIDGFVAKFEEITGIDLSPLIDTFQRAGEILQKFFDLFSDGVSEKIDSAGNAVRDFLGFFTEATAAGLNLVLDVIESLIENWDLTISVLAGVTAALVAYKAAMAISATIDAVKKAMDGLTLAQKAAAIAQAALNLVMNANPFVLIATLIIGLVTALVTFIANNEEAQAKLKAIWEAIKGFFLDAAEKIKAGWNTVIDFFKSLPATLKSFFIGIGDWFQNIGAQIVDGIKTGISNAWNGLTSFVGGLWDKLFGKSEEVNEIHSPSRRYARLAGMIVSGIEGGWADNFGRVIDQASADFNRLAGIGDSVALSAAPVPTATVDFSASALGRTSAATINSMFAMSGGGMPSKIVVPVNLNGRQIALATYDDLEDIRKQRG